MADDFDRSFEFFQRTFNGEDDHELTDIWKQNEQQKHRNHGTFDDSMDGGGGGGGDTSFEFSATSKPDNANGLEENIDFFSTDPFHKPRQQEPKKQSSTSKKYHNLSVRVAIHEQLSAMYDDFSQEGAISVTGSIRIEPSTALVQPTFCLVMKEASLNIQKLEMNESVCEEISDQIHDNEYDTSDRILKVRLGDNKDIDTENLLIAGYSCMPKLRPVPLLIKSRVRVSNTFVRVGFKIRANPTNESSMKNITIVMAVPPDVDGENVKTSRKGASWEELKRTLCWSVDTLQPGKALEIQAQFASLDGGGGGNSTRVPKFPVLVRCDYPVLFSGLELSSDCTTPDGVVPVKLTVTKSSRILHRKV